MKINHLLPAVFLVLLACSAPQEAVEKITKMSDNSVSVINPIQLDGVENAPTIYTIDAQHPEEIKIKRGGTLVFDENAFVDDNGKVIKGKVDVKWQEFHTLGDIMFSGIPMKYDSASVANNLVSGGMFTISASQGSNPVHIAPKKSVEVNLASIQDTPCYNFYELDEKTGDWKYETTLGSTPIEAEKKPVVTKEQVNPADPNLLDVTLETKKFPELKGLDIVAWRSKRTLSSFDKNMLQARGTALRLVKTDSLGLTLEARTNSKQLLHFAVEPYLMKEAQADSRVHAAKLEKDLESLVAYSNDVAEGRVIRSISIANFGTYNWDCIHQFVNPQRVMAEFSYPDKTNPKMITVFLISPDKNLVINCNSSGDNNFFFDPKLRNCLVGILPNNELVAISNRGFDEVRALESGKPYTFAFKKTGVILKSPQDIMNHMNSMI